MTLINDISKQEFHLSEAMHGDMNTKADYMAAELWATGNQVDKIQKSVSTIESQTKTNTIELGLFGIGLTMLIGLGVASIAAMKDEQERHNRRIEERLGLD